MKPTKEINFKKLLKSDQNKIKSVSTESLTVPLEQIENNVQAFYEAKIIPIKKIDFFYTEMWD